jgi:undecaprenyl diphosphate synthase
MPDKTENHQQAVPRHIAIIMDGNGRWAKRNNKARVYGHQQGVESVRRTVKACNNANVEFLTLYAFSTENWKRPEQEINALMELLVRTIRKETPDLKKQNVRIKMIGDSNALPEDCINELKEAMKMTENNTGLTLTLALSYSGRSEITNAMQAIASKVQAGLLHAEDIDHNTIEQHLYTAQMPDPELVIRTSGEYRISNYLLWQSAYAEFYFTSTLWPDFDEHELNKAIDSFRNRERRFGLISEQIDIK